MKLRATYQGGMRYDVTGGRHRLVTDQPVEDGGEDAGMSPVQLFVGSMAACVAYFVGRFCARHDIPLDGLAVDAEWATEERPHRVGRIGLSVHLPHPVPPELRERLLKTAHGCTVHQSVVTAPKIDIELVQPGSGEAHS
ncbi:MAG TPA: OsmC family protein [Nitrospira sp.]|nr:OsmC family protein [Nitrospira sp.]